MQSRAYSVFSSRTKKRLSREKPLRTLLRSNKVNKELQNVRCDVCGKILFQNFSGALMIIPGHPDTEINPELLTPDTEIIQCHGMLTIEKDGERINTRCSARYFVT